MKCKFILTNKITKEQTNCKSLREIAKLLNLDYFQIRSIYLESKKPKKYLHPITKHLVDKYTIIDNPELYV